MIVVALMQKLLDVKQIPLLYKKSKTEAVSQKFNLPIH